MSHVIYSHALTGEKPCINKEIHALLMHGYTSFNIVAVTRCLLPGPRTSIVRGNYVRETSVKRRNKIVQKITRNVAMFLVSMQLHKPGPLGGVENVGFRRPRFSTPPTEKPCLIPILKYFFLIYRILSETIYPFCFCLCFVLRHIP